MTGAWPRRAGTPPQPQARYAGGAPAGRRPGAPGPGSGDSPSRRTTPRPCHTGESPVKVAKPDVNPVRENPAPPAPSRPGAPMERGAATTLPRPKGPRPARPRQEPAARLDGGRGDGPHVRRAPGGAHDALRASGPVPAASLRGAGCRPVAAGKPPDAVGACDGETASWLPPPPTRRPASSTAARTRTAAPRPGCPRRASPRRAFSDQEAGREVGPLSGRFLFPTRVRPVASGAGGVHLPRAHPHAPTLRRVVTPGGFDRARGRLWRRLGRGGPPRPRGGLARAGPGPRPGGRPPAAPVGGGGPGPRLPGGPGGARPPHRGWRSPPGERPRGAGGEGGPAGGGGRPPVRGEGQPAAAGPGAARGAADARQPTGRPRPRAGQEDQAGRRRGPRAGPAGHGASPPAAPGRARAAPRPSPPADGGRGRPVPRRPDRERYRVVPHGRPGTGRRPPPGSK
jgi:hypothetical protein